jgi:hypothetical protein
MMGTAFWHPDGTPMWAQQFMEMLFGELPEFSQSAWSKTHHLRAILTKRADPEAIHRKHENARLPRKRVESPTGQVWMMGRRAAQNSSKSEARFIPGAARGGRLNRDIHEATTMNKSLLAFAAATSVAVSLLAAPPAEARCWGCAVGIGVAAGVVAGAVVGSAIANTYGPAYVVQPGYVAYPSYAVAAPVGCPGGYWARRPVAFDAYGNPIRWSRAHFFCPG